MIDNYIKGSDPLQFATKVETSPYLEYGVVFIDNPHTKKKSFQKKPYTKFIFIRDLDLVKTYWETALYKLEKEVESFKNKNFPEYHENKQTIETLKENKKNLNKEKKDIEDTYDDLSPKEKRLALHKDENYQEILNKISTIDEKRKELVQWNKDFLDELNGSKLKEGYKKKIERYQENATFSKSIKSQSEFEALLSFYNKKLKGKDKIRLEELNVSYDKEGKPYDRLEYGFKYALSTDGTFSVIVDFLRDVDLPLYGSEKHNNSYVNGIRNLDLFYRVNLNSQFLITTGIRLFKGIDDYEQIHRVCIDIETTSLYPLGQKCNSCGHLHKLKGVTDSIQKCKVCKSDKLEYHDLGNIFAIAMKDNRGFEKVYITDAEIKDGKFIIPKNDEIKIIYDMMVDLVKLKPSIIIGYNSENFDFNYILSRFERLGLRSSPIECPKCKKGKLNSSNNNSYYCNNCNFQFRKNQIATSWLLDDEMCGVCYNGVLQKQGELYQCNNCMNTLSISQQKNYIESFEKEIQTYVKTNPYSTTKPFSKSNFSSSLKLGAETENFHATKFFGATVLDTYFMVRAAKAIRSDIKKTSLKYIANFKPLKTHDDRTYVKGGDIFKIMKENKWYLTNSQSVYMVIPDEFQGNPEMFLAEINKYLPLKEGKFIAPKTKQEIHVDDNSDDFREWTYKEYYDHFKDEFKLINGKEIIHNYVLDDVKDTLAVDYAYTAVKMFSCKDFPIDFQEFYTKGNATAWNVFFAGYYYVNRLAFPHTIEFKIPVGGLSRTFVTGYSEDIQKVDYSSLYPTEILSSYFEKNKERILYAIPEYAPVLYNALLYFFNKRMFYNRRKKTYTKEQFIEFLKEENLLDRVEEVKKLEGEKLEKAMGDYRTRGDMFQLPNKININSFFGFLSSFVGNFADIYCGGFITAIGRQYIRLVIWYFNELGFTPLVVDTDGVNFSTPDTLTKDPLTLLELKSPIPFKEYEYKEQKGIEGLLKIFNEKYMPTTGFMKLSDDGVWINGINIAAKNYISNDEGKIKVTGNTLKNSNLTPFLLEFIKEIKVLMKELLDDKQQALYNFYQKYLVLAKKTVEGKLTLSQVVKMRKVKETLESYKNEKDKLDGITKIHMELLDENDEVATEGEIVYFVNNGLRKTHNDVDYINEIEEKMSVVKKCTHCHEISHLDPDNIPSKCEKSYRIKMPTLISELKKRAKKGNFNITKGIQTKLNKLPLKTKNYILKIYNEENEQVIDNLDFVLKQFYEKHQKDLGIEENDTQYHYLVNDCQGELVNTDEEKSKKIEVKIPRRVAYMVDEKEIVEKGNEIYPYNTEKYLDDLNHIFESLLCIYPKNVRDIITIQPNQEVIELQKEDFYITREQKDTVEEALSFSEKEIEFWNNYNRDFQPFNPLWIFDENPNKYSFHEWNNYNKDLKGKYSDKNKKHWMFTKPNDFYPVKVNGEIEMYKLDENGKSIMVGKRKIKND